MKAIALFMVFVAMFLLIQGYYSQASKCPVQQVEVKYMPRNLYNEQLTNNKDVNTVSKQFRGMFEDIKQINISPPTTTI